MTSRQFFGNWKFKDVNVTLYNEKGQTIYRTGTTTFAHVNPILKDEIKNAIEDYKKNWEYNGEPTRCEIFTTPAWNFCKVDLKTNKKEFKTN